MTQWYLIGYQVVNGPLPLSGGERDVFPVAPPRGDARPLEPGPGHRPHPEAQAGRFEHRAGAGEREWSGVEPRGLPLEPHDRAVALDPTEGHALVRQRAASFLDLGH